MAIVDDDVIFRKQHGRFDKWIYRVVKGHTVRSRYPDYSNMIRSERQLANQVRFKDATDYAKKVLANPELKAKYQKKVTGLQNAWNLAISDFMLQSKREKTDTSGYEALRRDLLNVSVKSENLVKNRGLAAARAVGLPEEVLRGVRVIDST
jgi:hypothetical protein